MHYRVCANFCWSLQLSHVIILHINCERTRSVKGKSLHTWYYHSELEVLEQLLSAIMHLMRNKQTSLLFGHWWCCNLTSIVNTYIVTISFQKIKQMISDKLYRKSIIARVTKNP